MHTLTRILALCTLLLMTAAPASSAEVSVYIAPKDYGLPDVENDVWLRATDTEAYYGLLHHASQVPDAALRAAGQEFIQQREQKTGLPTFVDMLRNSPEFKGQPVFLRGHILQTQKASALENPFGIETIYESSLFIDDAQGNLTTIVFLDKPEGLPIGGEMVDGVEVAGYFLKLYWYPANDNQTHKAPLILARTITLRAPTQHGPLVPAWISYPALLIGFLVLASIVWYVQRADRKRLVDRREEALEQQRPDFSGIKSDDAPQFPP